MAADVADDDSVGALLEAARDALAGVLTLPRSQGPRVAALLARRALEELVDDAVDGRAPGAREASMRVKLLCLTVLDPDVGHRASWAWHALSESCHQHAYELDPAPVEVAELVGQVERLATGGAAAESALPG